MFRAVQTFSVPRESHSLFFGQWTFEPLQLQLSGTPPVPSRYFWDFNAIPKSHLKYGALTGCLLSLFSFKSRVVFPDTCLINAQINNEPRGHAEGRNPQFQLIWAIYSFVPLSSRSLDPSEPSRRVPELIRLPFTTHYATVTFTRVLYRFAFPCGLVLRIWIGKF